MKKRNFTLIELLVVIGIIAILMGLILPAVGIAKKKAKVTKARSEIQSLKTAIAMFESTYGYLPAADIGTGADLHMNAENVLGSANENGYEWLIAVLSKTDDVDYGDYKDTGNPRGIGMLDLTKSGVYRDPWDEGGDNYVDYDEYKENDYQVVIDADYNNEIVEGDVPGLKDDVPTTIMIWSKGPDGEDNPTNDHLDNIDNIYSLETECNRNPDEFSGHYVK